MNDLLYSIGLDITDLKTSARAAKEQAEDVKRGFRGFKDVLEFGGVGMAVTSFFRSVIDYARELKGPLDENTSAVRRFGESIGEAKESTLGWGAQFLGVLNRSGEGLGMMLRSLVDGKEAVRQAAQLEREAQENIARIEAERKRNGEEHKRINTELKKVEEERLKVAEQGLTLQERISRATDAVVGAMVQHAAAQDGSIEKRRAALELQQTQLAREKLIGELAKENAKDRAQEIDEHIRKQDRLVKLKFDALSTEQKIAQLSKEEAAILAHIRSLEKEKLDTTDSQISLLELQAQLEQLRAKHTGETATAEAKITAEKLRQSEIPPPATNPPPTPPTPTSPPVPEKKDFGLPSFLRQTTADRDMSDRELAERASNLRRQLDEHALNLASGVGLSPFGRLGNPFVGQMAADLERIQDEQAYRRRFRQAYGQQGEAALERFSAFDEERLRNYVRPEDEKRAAMTLETLQDIAARLAGTKPFGAKL